MGKAGQALRQVLEAYDINQSALATGLGVERSIVFRWYHEQTDPTAETVAQIVQALQIINISAAKDFIQVYLGDLTQTVNATISQDLPPSDRVNVSVLSQIFDKTTNSYKYLFFLSLLDILKRRNFDTLSPVTFQEIIIEIIANAWYPHNYFKLSFGTQDQIANKLDSLDLVISEPILQFRDADKKLLRKTIQGQNLDDIVKDIGRYVPFRLIRPFFTHKTRGLKDYDVNPSVCELANNQFEVTKPLYCFDSTSYKDCTAIILHQDWIEYIAENYSIVRGWVSWEWLNYMQSKNINIPNIVSKLFIPQQRDSLSKQTKYWKLILNHQKIKCIYSQIELDKNSISLDHYLPWSFVAHDQLWNLIPTTPSVNSSKSNNIPAEKYFTDFVKLQHQGLTIYAQNNSERKWHNYAEDYIAELKVNKADDLLNIDILNNAYQATLQPLVSLAAIQGFKQNWIYQSNQN
ncbi:HNH endonuclease domain-containing protein [Pleurocapsa sp. PCC 7319]|uniref:HNH endonuclease domain-containing protein n=1 Tax=Pleurocapsa sp. PCC 7319 TaxID=118161 RepID=UPI00034C684D|nr:HNH endonuclease domain-containing protein [Pleurocapsa sp. PCC 7319]